MYEYNKDEIKEQITIDEVEMLCNNWGGEPIRTPFGLTLTTICHNLPQEGSRKLYYYENSRLFKCYTECDSTFDIFELYIKVSKIQENKDVGLIEAIRFIGSTIGANLYQKEEKVSLPDWDIFKRYDKIDNIKVSAPTIQQKFYNFKILKNFNYKVRLTPWLDEGISQEVLDFAMIGYYPGGDQITIPHFNKDNKLIGIRGRSLCEEDCERFGKYRPLKINNILYTHPLGTNLYGLNWAKDNIKKIKKAVIVESEKSVLKYMTYFGIENNICVACCGSAISEFQINDLIECGAEEVVIALDRQFQEIKDDEWKHLVKNLKKISKKYSRNILVSIIFDKNKITDYKSAPLDHGPEVFLKLYKNRIIL